MKLNILKRCVSLLIISLVLIIFANNTYASFADYDDKTADEKANVELQEQEKQDAENIGKSSNNFLSALSVEGYKLTPEFNKQTINYSIEKEVTDNSIQINATADDERATINGFGTVDLQSGKNTILVDVIAENGIQRTYFIEVNKKIESEELKLKELTIKDESNENIALTPSFDKNTYKYNCTVYNTIDNLNIEAITDTENSVVKVEGNKNLQIGENVVTITVTSVDGENETIYKINVVREEAVNRIETSNKLDNKLILGIFLCGALVIVTIILLINNGIKKNKRKH